MPGDITNHIDVAQIALYLFWAFFFVLIYYLQREGKREGYPLVREDGEVQSGFVDYFPPVPEPKSFELPHGEGTKYAPDMHEGDKRGDVPLQRISGAVSDPYEPTGNPLEDGVGPAAWAAREDKPDLTLEGKPSIVPLSSDDEFQLLDGDIDPRGLDIWGNDLEIAGTCTDIWVDRAEHLIRYVEMQIKDSEKKVLIPMNLVTLHRGAPFRGPKGKILVRSLLSDQFANCPAPKSATEVTRLEEDKIMAYFAGGKFFQTPRSRDPLV
ncbi:MAG: photosynthetic reaction center subunit H [Pseudomonadota bacterium]